MPPLIFDDRGNCWIIDSPSFRAAFGNAGLCGDAPAFLIETAGFVGVTLHRAGLIVRFNPGSVAGAALAGLYQWLRRRRYDRLRLAYGGWGETGYMVLGAGLTAFRRIEALIERSRGPQSRFISLEERPEALSDVPAFAALFAQWRASGALYEEVVYRPLLRRFAHERYIVLEPRAGSADLDVIAAGRGLHIPDRQAHAALKGARLSEIADNAYARWAAGIYGNVLERREPRFDQIHAVIYWPRAGPVERRYWRMILPCRTGDGGHRLLGVSCEPGPLNDHGRRSTERQG
jgi:hypothetical protein